MRWRDGSAAFVALILALACAARADGQEMIGQEPAEQTTFGQHPVDARMFLANAAEDFSEDSSVDSAVDSSEDLTLLSQDTLLTQEPSLYRPMLALRYGWWAVTSQGDPTKVGEYQALRSSAFFDADILHSDGLSTTDLSISSLDNETTQVGLDYFGPRLHADIDFQRFLHRLDHDPLSNMGDLQSGEEIIREDLNVGEDYAIRIQDLKTSFRGKLGDHVKLRLNFRFLRKYGERQANSVQHCAPGIPQDFNAVLQNHCHVMSQRQRIDWKTVKFEPVIEANFGSFRAEYSRPMRIFDRNDQILTRPFGVHPAIEIDQNYAFVPESFTQSDRLKLGIDLAADTRFYARMQVGNTRNKFRQTHRKFHGFDLRLTNQSLDGVTLTGYATLNEQRNQSLPFLLPTEQAALAVPTATIPPYGIRRPINYARRTVGADSSWRPFRNDVTFKGLGFTLGVEQGVIERDNAEYVVQVPEQPPGPILDQKRTVYTSFHIGATHRWSPNLESFVRYKLRDTQDPLFAVNRYYGYTNTNRPTEENLTEVGGTFTLGAHFMATASVGFLDRHHHSEIADFEEDDYPMTFTMWYAPTPKWSLSAGYGSYSNWIDQNVTFPSDTPAAETGDTRRWSYGGRGDVLSVGGSYACNRYWTLSGGVQFVWSQNAIDPLTPWPDLPDYFDVVVNRARITGGVDWSPNDCISLYFRYLYEDYEDMSVDYNSGTTNMFLTGLSAVY